MTKIMACVDGSSFAASVCDHAGWAAQRLGLPVEVLHALGRRELSSTPVDLGGNLDFDAGDALLKELTNFDAQRAKLAARRGRLVLDHAVARLRAMGASPITTQLRHGDVTEAISETGTGVRILVIGKRGEAASFAKAHLGSNLERVVRASTVPVLIVPDRFQPLERFMVAFDGGPSSLRIIERLVASPLLHGLECNLFMAGEANGEAGRRLNEARQQLEAAGYKVHVKIAEGDADAMIIKTMEQRSVDLLVMGAYGHSRIRNLIVGSTTTAVIQACERPVLVIR